LKKWGEKKVKREEILPNPFFRINYLHQTEVYTVLKTQIYTQPTLDNVTGDQNLRIMHRQK
jgi:hypothetical protein